MLPSLVPGRASSGSGQSSGNTRTQYGSNVSSRHVHYDENIRTSIKDEVMDLLNFDRFPNDDQDDHVNYGGGERNRWVTMCDPPSGHGGPQVSKRRHEGRDGNCDKRPRQGEFDQKHSQPKWQPRRSPSSKANQKSVENWAASHIEPPIPNVAPTENIVRQCQLCPTSNVFYKSQEELAVHATVIHFRENILRRTRGLTECLTCGFRPKGCPEDSQAFTEELLIHFGVNEKLSLKYYHDEVDALAKERAQGNNRRPEASGTKSATEKFRCEICKKDHDNDRLFVRHITLSHFKEKLEEELPKNPPYLCPEVTCTLVKATLHGLVLHFGSDHHMSRKLYQKEIEKKGRDARLNVGAKTTSLKSREPKIIEEKATQSKTDGDTTPGPEVAVPPRVTSAALALYSCILCNGKKSFMTQMSLKMHLTESHHLPPAVIALNSAPYTCPKCHKEISEKLPFYTHFIETHRDILLNGKTPRQSNPSNNNTAAAGDVTSQRDVTKTSDNNKVGVNDTSTAVTNVSQKTMNSSTTSPCSKLNPTLDKVVHLSKKDSSELTARQRVVRDWERTSIDASKHKIKELEDKITKLQDAHAEDLKKRVEDFESWIRRKEVALEHEKKCRKEVESQLAQANVGKLDLEKKQEQSVENSKRLEATLAEKEAKNAELAEKIRIVEESLELRDTKIKELSGKILDSEKVHSQAVEEVKQQEETIKELELNIHNKGEKILAQAKDADKLENKLKHLEKQVGQQKTKVGELVEQKNSLLLRHKKEETNLRSRIEKLLKKNQVLVRKEKKDCTMSDRLEELQQVLCKSEARCEELERERNMCLDSCDKFQRLILDFEVMLKDKNRKLKEKRKLLEDNEANLEEAMAKITELKHVEQEKRKLKEEGAQLRMDLEDLKGRQLNKVELMNRLEHDNEELKSKMRLLKNNSDVRRMNSLENKLHKTQAELAVSEENNITAITRLHTQDKDLDSLRSDNLGLQAQVRGLREGHREKVEELSTKLRNREGELTHVCDTLNRLKNKYHTVRLENERLKAAEVSVEGNATVTEPRPINLKQEVAFVQSSSVNYIDASDIDSMLTAGVRSEGLDNDSSVVIFDDDPPNMAGNARDISRDRGESAEFLPTTTTDPVVVVSGSRVPPGPNVTVVGYNKSESLTVCGICDQHEPPLKPLSLSSESTTDWIDCSSCHRLFHKACTNLTRFSRFSCKSVKLKCMGSEEKRKKKISR